MTLKQLTALTTDELLELREDTGRELTFTVPKNSYTISSSNPIGTQLLADINTVLAFRRRKAQSF